VTVSGPAGILVVDDEPAVCDVVTQVLQRAGYRAVPASSGMEALALLRDGPFDVMVTDLRMPGMGGPELVERTRALYPDVDIIVLTAYATVESAIRLLRLGARDYILKPFDVQDLTSKVAHCISDRLARLASRQAPPEPLLALHRVVAGAATVEEACQEIIALIADRFVVDTISLALFEPWSAPEALGGALRPGLDPALRVVSPGEPCLADASAALGRDSEPWVLETLTEPDGTSFAVTVPLESRGVRLGLLRLERRAPAGPYLPSEAQSLGIFGAHLALAILQGRTRAEMRSALNRIGELNAGAARALVAALGIFDDSTREHSERVSEYARELACCLQLSDSQVQIVSLAGLLHDIGKIGLSGRTLRKSGSLTPAERERVLMHPVQGAEILSGMESLREVVPLVRHHHERYDGRGYPDGLSGEAIPLGARLLAVVDAYDSMTSDRPYRPTLAQEEAMRRLSRGAGAQWDPEIVAAWLDWVTGRGEPAAVGSARGLA